MQPAPIRNAVLFSPSLWGESLLATGIRTSKSFAAIGQFQEFRGFLIEHLSTAMCFGGLEVSAADDACYAFEQAVSADDLGIAGEPTESDRETSVRQLITVRSEFEQVGGLRPILAGLRNSTDEVATVYCVNLRCLQLKRGIDGPLIKEFLSDNDWREEVFHHLPETVWETFVTFLVDWQLNQDDDWYTRVPQVFAYECERAKDDTHEEMLLFATFISALASDVTSPIARLVLGSKRDKLLKTSEKWCQTIRLFARESEPWVAARVRGLLGSLGVHIRTP